jgi:hypothetical protein
MSQPCDHCGKEGRCLYSYWGEKRQDYCSLLCKYAAHPPRTAHELRHAIGETYAKLYWDCGHRRLRELGHQGDLFGILPPEDRVPLRRLYRQLNKRYDAKDCVPELNERGNEIERSHRDADRYLFDFRLCKAENGWQQFDTNQDASYFGIWKHAGRLEILTYAEGDVTRVKCPDAAHYNAEIKSMCEFYGEGFEMIACDADAFSHIMLGGDIKGETTVYRQDRSRFFIPE